MSKPTPEPVLLGASLCTPVGLCAAMVASQVAAGTKGFTELDVALDDGDRVRGSRLALLDGSHDRTDRMAALCTAAAAEITLALRREHVEGSVPVFLGLPPEESGGVLDLAGVTASIEETLELVITAELRDEWMYPTGRAAFFHALEAALLHVRAGRAPYALAGAVDCLCDDDSVNGLVVDRRILGQVLDGVLPGEGAGFVLIGPDPGEGSVVRVLGVTHAREPHPFRAPEPNLAEGLTAAFAALRARPSCGGRRLDAVFACQTGEGHWTREFTAAYLRNPAFMPEPLRYHVVAEAHGDAGAASGVIQLVTAAGAYAGGAPERRALVYGCDDAGEIGACVIEGRGLRLPTIDEAPAFADDPGRAAFLEGLFRQNLTDLGFLLLQPYLRLRQSLGPWTGEAVPQERVAPLVAALVWGAGAARDAAWKCLEEDDDDAIAGAIHFLAASDPAAPGRLAEAFAKTEGPVREAWALGLRSCTSESVRAEVAGLLDTPDLQATVADLLGTWRYPADDRLRALVTSEQSAPDARGAAAWSLARLGAAGAALEVGDAFRRCPGSFELAASALVLGESGALDRLRWLLGARDPGAGARLPLLLGVAGGPSDDRLLASLLDDPRLAPAALEGLGLLGTPASVPLLVARLSSPVARERQAAAAALEWLTGAGLPPPDASSDDDEPFDPDRDPTVCTDPAAWQAWWQANNARFPAGSRYRRGRPFTLEACLSELEDPQSRHAVRLRASLELAVRAPRPLVLDPSWPVEDQHRVVGEWRAFLRSQAPPQGPARPRPRPG